MVNVINCHPAIDSFENDDDVEDGEDPFLDNPRYKYSFNIVDEEEQTYQDQSQQMEDRVTKLNEKKASETPLYLAVHLITVSFLFQIF